MIHDEVQIGDTVIYHPPVSKAFFIIDENNMGVVTSKNDKFIFVRYNGMEGSQATKAEDLTKIELN